MSDAYLFLDKSLEAQQSVIGSMLIDEKCIPVVLSQLRAEDFIDGACRNTYRAIQNLFQDGKPVDMTILKDAVGGGEEYFRWLRELMEVTVTAAHVEIYADIVRRSAIRHRIREEIAKLEFSADLDDDAAIIRKASGLLSATSRMPRMTAAELAKDFLSRMSSTEKPNYLPWGFPTLNTFVQSELGDFIILGGYPSAGKTLLSVQMSLAVAKRYRVGYYSLETKPEKMADRIFSHLSGVSMGNIKHRNFGEKEWQEFAKATSLFASNCPVDVIRAAGSTVEDIAADAIANNYQFIVIDYIQLIRTPGIHPGDRTAAVTHISASLHSFAQQHNIAVLGLSQLARPEKAGSKGSSNAIAPSMHSLRESGQLEQDADVIFLVYASNQNDNSSARVLKIAKNKDGERKAVNLAFDGATQTMAEVMESGSSAVATEYSAIGRQAKRQNRSAAGQQMAFRELTGDEQDNPFEQEF